MIFATQATIYLKDRLIARGPLKTLFAGIVWLLDKLPPAIAREDLTSLESSRWASGSRGTNPDLLGVKTS